MKVREPYACSQRRTFNMYALIFRLMVHITTAKLVLLLATVVEQVPSPTDFASLARARRGACRSLSVPTQTWECVFVF